MPPATRLSSKKMLWTSYGLSALPALMFHMSATRKFIPGLLKNLVLGLGVLELACTILYVIPRTAVAGAILLTRYRGGATCTRLRAGDPFIMPAILGAVVWGGLFLREPRLRALIPLRRKENLVVLSTRARSS